MGEDLHVRIPDGPDDPPGHLSFLHVEAGVDRSQDDLAFLQNFILQVQGAVGQDVDFHAFQNPESGDFTIGLFDLL